MAVVSIKNKLRRGNLLAGNDPYIPTDFESIATVTVGSGGAANVEFTSIPGTYTHLQIRYFARTSESANSTFIYARINSDTGNNYASHRISGNGSSATANATSSNGQAWLGWAGAQNNTNNFGAGVIDILDYANTNKYKTIRSLNGYDGNGNGIAYFGSALWMNTNAITTIQIGPDLITPGVNLSQYSHFALYGIKGA